MSETSNPIAPDQVEADILEFARVFRAAARAVSFYPGQHPTVQTTLTQLVDMTRQATRRGPVALTVLPTTVLVNGLSLRTPGATTELATILHRHGIGALGLNPRGSIESWKALLRLLALPPEELRACGGIGRRWAKAGHACPALLEIDFGELLRGRIGGGMAELSGVISHYLENGVAPSVSDAAHQLLLETLNPSAPAAEQVDALLRVLRSVAQFAQLKREVHLSQAFARAATLAEHLSEEVMAGLLARRGTPETRVGTVDVVATFVDCLSDETLAHFFGRAVAAGAKASPRLAEIFATLIPDQERAKRVLLMAQAHVGGAVTIEAGFLDVWSRIEGSLESLSNRDYVADAYAQELHGARQGSLAAFVPEDPPERVNAWLATMDDAALADLDLQLLIDLNEGDLDPFRWRELLEVLSDYALEAAEAGRWHAAATVLEAMARDAGDGGHPLRRPFAADAMAGLWQSRLTELALEALPADDDGAARALRTGGTAPLTVVVNRWRREVRPAIRGRLEGIMAAYGQPGLDALYALLDAAEPEAIAAVIGLLRRLGGFRDPARLERFVADPNTGVRREALRALAAAGAEAGDAFGRALGDAEASVQPGLVDELALVGGKHAVPILSHLVAHLDQLAVGTATYGSVIEALRLAGTDEAVVALEGACRRYRWSAPYRSYRFSAAAVTALGRIGNAPARQALQTIGSGGSIVARLLGRLELQRMSQTSNAGGPS